MAGEIGRDLRVRLIIDSSDSDSKLPKTIGHFTELNSALELANKAFALAAQGWQALTGTIERGQQFSELSNAFKNLYGSTTTFANDGLGTLREALQGTVSDLDIMRAANVAAQAELSPEAFLKVAEAAESLGDIVGKNAKDAMDDLSYGISVGNERLLKQYGILVDNAKAEEAFAKSLGTTADKLSEEGKKEAFRVEALKQLAEKAKAAGDAGKTAGDLLEQFGVKVDNAKDAVANLINQSSTVKTFFTILINFTENATLALEKFANVTTRANIANLQSQLADIDTKIKQQGDPAAGFFGHINYDGTTHAQAIVDLQKQRAAIEEQIKGLTDTYKREIGLITQGSDPFRLGAAFESAFGAIDGALEDVNKYVKTNTGEIEKQAEAIKKQLADLSKLDAEMKENSLGKAIQESIDSLDTSAFNSLLGNYRQAIYDNTLEGLRQSFKDLPEDELAQRATILTDEKIQEATKALEEKATEAFQNSVGVFEDLFQNAIDGTTFNLEDALKRVAVGFAAQMSASIAESLGINVSGITGAGGIGQAIASSIGFGGGGQAGIGSIFSGIFGGAAGGGIDTGINGVSAAAGRGGPAIGAAGPLGFGPWAGIGAGAAITGYSAYDFYNSIRGGSKPSLFSQIALAPLTGGFSFAGSLFGGSEDPERLAREDMISKLIEQMGGQNRFNLDAGNYNVDSSRPGMGATVGLTNPLGAILTGGNDKLGSDLAGIFANAVSAGDNFNQTLIRTQSLMSDLGINAEEAKGQLTDLFLDGKISADEFASGIENLNVLAQDNLVGQGSVKDAISVLTDAMSTPRERIHAIGLAFGEMKEVGIDTTGEISAYLSSNFGPEVSSVFDQILASGIDTFEEIANATPDQIAIIAQALQALGIDIRGSIEEGADGAEKAFKKSADAIIDKIKEINKATKDAATGLKNLQVSGRTSIGSGLNQNAA